MCRSHSVHVRGQVHIADGFCHPHEPVVVHVMRLAGDYVPQCPTGSDLRTTTSLIVKELELFQRQPHFPLACLALYVGAAGVALPKERTEALPQPTRKFNKKNREFIVGPARNCNG